MTCPLHDELSAYIDGLLEDQSHERLVSHLQSCPVCRQRLEALHSLQHNMRALPSPALGFDLAARLEERLRPVSAPRRPSRWFLPNWLPAGVVAASLGAGVWLGGGLIGGSIVNLPQATMVRVFDPVPPGGLCAAPELCRLSKGMQ